MESPIPNSRFQLDLFIIIKQYRGKLLNYKST